MAKGQNPWASEFDYAGVRTLIGELRTEGKPWDKLESDPKKWISNFRRICPKRPEWQYPFQIVPVHYLGPNNRMVVCVEQARLGECPACRLRWALQSGGDERGARELRPSVRTFLNVVRIDQEGKLTEDKVFLLGLNQLQFMGRQGDEFDLDEEGDLPLWYFFEKYGDLSHIETGRDLEIRCKQTKMGDYDVLAMKFSVADASPFPGSTELLEQGLIDLPAVVPVLEPSEVVAVIEGRESGGLLLAAPGASAITGVPIADAPPVEKSNRFAHHEDEETGVEETEEEQPADARAPQGQPPKTDVAAAVERLQKNVQQKNGK